MRTLLLATLLGSAGLFAGAGAGCASEAAPGGAAKAQASIGTITVDQLEASLAKGECSAVDANGDATRKKLGVIPGAVLLSDYDTYMPGELPADKSKGLVFYCANEHCGASDEAAAKAVAAGYTNVKVLPSGILGWSKAGKQTLKL